MTAKDKAQAGLWMIQQAVLQLIEEKGPMQAAQVCDGLGIRWRTSEGELSAGIGYQIVCAMAEAGQLVKDPGSHPTYSIRPGTTR